MTDFPKDYQPILWGLVGSHAFGLATASSDEDYLGIFQVKTEDLLGLDGVEQTIVHTDPDWQMHELKKYIDLALQGNPTILDLIWLDEYVVKSEAGEELISMRKEILSSKVRKTYAGYAKHQMQRAANKVKDPTLPLEGRALKNMKHNFRLLNQGIHLLKTGELQVKLPNPEEYHALSTVPFEELEARFHYKDEELATIATDLPDEPNRALLSAWLVEKRRGMMEPDPVLLAKIENAKEAIRLIYRQMGTTEHVFGSSQISP